MSKISSFYASKVKRARIRGTLSDATFESTVNATETAAWQDSSDVVTTFLGNKKDLNYTHIVNELLDAFEDL
jgi:Tfp pilus assembly protein PilX